MRSILFRHEMKAKHVKKIKSKTYHRLPKKDKLKAAFAGSQTDPEAAKKLALKQEIKRAEERMTLKHKNTSKWVKHILERGLNAQDEGTRVAITEQLHQHAILTRKMNSMKDSSSSDESGDDDDDDLSPSTEQDRALKLLSNAKEKTVRVMEEENEIPKSGVLSLPFMVRGLKKREEEANAEAKLALEEYESQLKQIEDGNGPGSPKEGASSGRRVFGTTIKQHEKSEDAVIMKNIGRDSDSEDEYKSEDNVGVERAKNGVLRKEVRVDVNMLRDDTDDDRNLIYKAEKLHTKSLPFPFTSKEVFEQSIRVPIGPEFNPATSVGALIRPEVVKKPGVIIKPIKFEEVNPHDKEDQHRPKAEHQKTKNHSSSSGKATNKSKRKQKN